MFVRDRHPVRHVGLVRRLRLGHQFGHLGPQLRLDLARMLIGQRAVAAGVGVDLGAVERDRAQLQHPHLAGKLQYLDEQCLDLLEEAPPEHGDRVVVWVLIGSSEAECHRIIRRPLQLAAGEHAGGVAVDQDAQQHRRVVGGLTGTAVAAKHRPQIQARNHLHHEPRQMLLRQPFIHRWRHQETSVAVDRTEVLHAGKVRGAEKAKQRP
jgi:hypothetical protein